MNGRSFGGPGCPPPTRLAPWGRGCPDHRTCPPFPQMAPRFQTKRKDRRQNALSGGNTHYVSTITPQIADSWYSCAGMLVGCLVFGNTHLLNFFITKKINTLSICAFLHTLAHRRDAHKLRGFHYPLCHMRSIAHMFAMAITIVSCAQQCGGMGKRLWVCRQPPPTAPPGWFPKHRSSHFKLPGITTLCHTVFPDFSQRVC